VTPGFVEFVHDDATQLGRLIDTPAGGQGDARGYLTARACLGALTAGGLLQDPTRPGLDPAGRCQPNTSATWPSPPCREPA
jgi:hypothetical protein